MCSLGFSLARSSLSSTNSRRDLQESLREEQLQGRNSLSNALEHAILRNVHARGRHVSARFDSRSLLRTAAIAPQVPPGKVTTCGALAAALGSPMAAKWIGHFLLHHDHDAHRACHRVLRAGGRLGGYIQGDVAAKCRRLAAEGVEVRHDLVDLCDLRPRPLCLGLSTRQIAANSRDLAAQVVLEAPRELPLLVGGVDVSYPRPGEGVAGYALVALDGGRLLWSQTIRRKIRFPYITSFLTFRELPILLELLDEVRAAGRLAAAPFGRWQRDSPSPACGRRLASRCGGRCAYDRRHQKAALWAGHIDGLAPLQSRPVILKIETIGVALRPTAGSRRPIFISPGHRVDVAAPNRSCAACCSVIGCRSRFIGPTVSAAAPRTIDPRLVCKNMPKLRKTSGVAGSRGCDMPPVSLAHP